MPRSIDCLPSEYLDLVFEIDAASDRTYPVTVRSGDGTQFSGGQLALAPALLSPTTPKVNAPLLHKQLHEALFQSDEVRCAYQQAVGAVRSHGAPWQGLRVRLAIDAKAAALQALAWERIYHEREGEWGPLATSAKTPFSRYIELERPHPPPALPAPVRILYVVANPAETDGTPASIDVGAEVANFAAALADDPAADYRLTVMPGRTGLSEEQRKALAATGANIVEGPTTLINIVAHLQRGYEVLHFLGHGIFNRETSKASLYLEDDQGKCDYALDHYVASKIRDLYRPPRLIFLAACESATRSGHGAFVGLAPKLVRAGAAAVVAMQDRVRMDDAKELTRRFYARLFDHGIVDLALNEARSLLHRTSRFGWAIPALFTRLRDGRLFAPTEAGAGTQIQTTTPPAIRASPTSDEPAGVASVLLSMGRLPDDLSEPERRAALELAREIGRALAGTPYRVLFSGRSGEPAYDASVAFRDALAPDEVKHRLISYIPTKSYSEPSRSYESLGLEVPIGEAPAERRETLVRHSDLVIAMGGRDGTAHTLGLAERMGRPVIPIARFRGAAADYYRESFVSKMCEADRPDIPASLDAPPERLAKVVVELTEWFLANSRPREEIDPEADG